MAVRVAVALRIHLGRLRIVDHALVVATDVVVDGVRHFAGVHPAREVPHQAVVVRRDAHRRRVLVGASAEERELLVEKRRHLVVEAEQGGGQSAVVKLEAGHLHRVEVGAEADRRIEGIGVRLVPEEVVEVGQPGNGELELLVRVRIADAELERHGLGLGKDGLVELYEADARQVVLVEGHVALVGRAGLADHRDRGLGLVFREVAHALRKRRHVVQHALHPPFGERRRIGPLGPLVAHHRKGRRAVGGRAVAHRVVGVDHVGERVALLADHETRKAVGRRELLRVFVVEVGGHHAVGARAALAPLEDVVFRRARERFRVDDRELLRKEVEGILARDDPARVVFGHDPEEVHVDRVACRDAHQPVRRVVLDDRHVVGGAHREDRVVVARLVVDDVLGGGDGTVPRRLDPPLRKRVDGGAPRGLARFARRLVHERLERFAFRVGKDVHVEERNAARIVLALAFELEAVRHFRRRVEVEALGDGRRQAVERPLPLPERRVAARPLLDAEVGDGRRNRRVGRDGESGGLRHRRVEEDGRRVTLRIRRRPHDANRLRVPDFRQAGRRRCERTPDFHLRHFLRPFDGPSPGGRLGSQRIPGRHLPVQERKPRHGFAHGRPA